MVVAWGVRFVFQGGSAKRAALLAEAALNVLSFCLF
jgi:hypothetical protein